MNSISRPSAQAVSAVFGAMMVVLAGFGANGAGLVADAAALIAVGVGVAFRPAATVAVLLSVVTIAVSGPPLMAVAWSGLSAVAYLVSRHAAGTPGGGATWSWPTAVAAVGFTSAGMVAAAFPLQVPWLPLAAPLAALATYVVATRPFTG